MKLAVDIRHLTHPSLTGVGQYTVQLLRALSRLAERHDITLFASGSEKTLARLPATPPDFRLVKKILPNRLVFSLLRLPGGPTLESFLPEPVDGWWFPDANIVRTDLPYVLTVHDLTPDIFPRFFTRKNRLRNSVARLRTLTANAAHLLTVSQSTAWDLEERFGIAPDRMTAIPLGVGSQFTPRLAPSDKNYLRGYGLTRPYILALATQEPRKNLESVIEAYDAYREEYAPGAQAPQLVLAGSRGWRNKPVSSTLTKAKFRDDIVNLGYVHENHKAALYRGASVFIFPSFYEGFGLPALEAMACGTPVVTSFTGSLPEVVGDAAIMIDPLNVNDLKTTLHLLLDNADAPVLRQGLHERGVQRAKNFSWDKTARETLAVLETALANK